MSANSQSPLHQKLTAAVDGEPVVFLVGMRINKWWRVRAWWPVFTAAGTMMRRLEREPEHGMLGQHTWLGRTIIIVQYWRSFDALERWAQARDQPHKSAWVRFWQRVGLSGDVGIWHETYRISPGSHESIYVNMPPFGLAKATQARPLGPRGARARDRMGLAPSSHERERTAV